MALNNHVLTLKEPSIKLDEFKFESFGEEKGKNKISTSLGFDGAPLVGINGFFFREEQIKFLEVRLDDIIPTISLSIIDTEGVFRLDNYPRDGDVINLRIASRQQKDYKDIRIDFDIESVDSPLKNTMVQNEIGNRYTFIGTMKVPGLYAEKCESYGEGTSLDHLTQIAENLQIGLATNIDTTDDKMNLVTAYQPIIETIKDISTHSYINDESFQTVSIDPYYYINYVNLHDLLNSEENFDEETLLNFIESYDEDPNFPNDGVNEIRSKLIISNHPLLENTNFYVDKFSLNNKSGRKVKRDGYKRILQYFENDSEEGLVNFDIEPQDDNNRKDIVEPLRGRRGEERYKEEIKYKYMGRISADDNTHIHYKYAELNNLQNIENLDKLTLKVELASFNPAIHRYQKVPVVIFNTSDLQVGVDGVLKDEKKKQGFDSSPKADLNDELSDKTSIDDFLSGFYVIKDITYKYKNRIGKVVQELTLVRREWPTRMNNIR